MVCMKRKLFKITSKHCKVAGVCLPERKNNDGREQPRNAAAQQGGNPGAQPWKRAHGLPAEGVLIMFWTATAAGRIYRLAQRRNTSDAVTLAICLAFLGYNLVKFFQIFR